ncbi:recombinase family protein [bacterium SCSIO 12696]|nr:recombinase family protein [bacterium SCSIO 12696]
MTKEPLRYAYLYSRVSKEKQATTGQGLQRQEEAALNFLRQHPEYTLSEHTFTDAGVSGFDGSNLNVDSGLGSFLAAAKRGEIPEDSLLVVEAPDRLSRLGISAGEDLVREVFSHKINIALVRFNLILEHNDNNNIQNTIIASVGFYLAHLESKQKSERIRSSIRKRQAIAASGGVKRTEVCPAWLTLSNDRREFIVNEERANLVKRMFDMKLNRQLGPDKIARQLNKEGIPSFTGKLWGRGTIRQYLTNPKVIGEFQPTIIKSEKGIKKTTSDGEPIQGYYPAIIEKDVFYATQATFRKAEFKRIGNFANLFQKITICTFCGGTVGYKQSGPRSKGAVYLKCNNSNYNRGCKSPGIKYHLAEKVLVQILSGLDYSRFSQTKENDTINSEIDQLSLKIQALEEKITINVENADMGSKAIRQKFVEKANNLENQKQEYLEKLSILKSRSRSFQTDHSIPADIDLESFEGRSKFNEFLKRNITSIKVSKHSIHILFPSKQYINIDIANIFEKSEKEIDELSIQSRVKEYSTPSGFYIYGDHITEQSLHEESSGDDYPYEEDPPEMTLEQLAEVPEDQLHASQITLAEIEKSRGQ